MIKNYFASHLAFFESAGCAFFLYFSFEFTILQDLNEKTIASMIQNAFGASFSFYTKNCLVMNLSVNNNGVTSEFLNTGT